MINIREEIRKVELSLFSHRNIPTSFLFSDKEIREPTRIFRVSGLFDKMLRNKREKGKTTANIPFSTNYTALSSV